MLHPAIGTSYYVGSATTTGTPVEMARISAAVLAGGERAYLGGEHVAVLRGVWNRKPGRIDVWSHGIHGTDVHPDVVYHRVADDASERRLEVVDGIAAVGVLDMLLQLGQTLDEWQLPFVFNESECAGLLDRAAFDAALRGARGRRGVRTLRAGWSHYLAGSTGTHNATEDRLLRRLVQIAEPPLVSVRNATGIAGLVPDFVYVRRGKVLEVDGRWVHGRPMAAEADRARDDMHHRLGWRVMRIPAWRVWYDLEQLVRDIIDFLEIGTRAGVRSLAR